MEALHARLAKDAALAAAAEERRPHAARSAELYAKIFERTGGFYPAVNAATMSMLADEVETARRLAREVLERVQQSDADYYGAATEAEAHLLLGDSEAARTALQGAARLHGGDHGAVATTRRQLRLVCTLTGQDSDLLGELAGPTVVHYCGHRMARPGETGRFSAGAEQLVARRLAVEVRRHRPAYAYGALASGADIMWAEALLAEDAELHVVLPFNCQEFVQTSVAPAGSRWVARFERCLAQACAITYATDDAFLGDDVLYRYGSELAMGLALQRAGYLDGEARQLVLWDGGPAAGAAGTAIDVATWRQVGRPVTVVSPGKPPDPPPAPAPPPAAPVSGRVLRAMLFADVRGFSKLTDEQLPRFADHVLGAFAEVLGRYEDQVAHSNTWGDALYVVLRDPVPAAACALDLQIAMAALDLQAAGLPSHLALRLSGHIGPVFEVKDPILRATAFMGTHVSRTARIEPVTPPGSVYVTEPFAAALALAGCDEFASEYVGHMPAAKDYGRLRMYSLRRRQPRARA